jgi:hypothetical protein
VSLQSPFWDTRWMEDLCRRNTTPRDADFRPCHDMNSNPHSHRDRLRLQRNKSLAPTQGRQTSAYRRWCIFKDYPRCLFLEYVSSPKFQEGVWRKMVSVTLIVSKCLFLVGGKPVFRSGKAICLTVLFMAWHVSRVLHPLMILKDWVYKSSDPGLPTLVR